MFVSQRISHSDLVTNPNPIVSMVKLLLRRDHNQKGNLRTDTYLLFKSNKIKITVESKEVK